MNKPNILEEIGVLNPPIYHKEWWDLAKPIFEEYQEKSQKWDIVVKYIPILESLDTPVLIEHYFKNTKLFKREVKADD